MSLLVLGAGRPCASRELFDMGVDREGGSPACQEEGPAGRTPPALLGAPRDAGSHQITDQPPSTTSVWPVMNDPAELASSSSAPSSSSTAPGRRIGVRLLIQS